MPHYLTTRKNLKLQLSPGLVTSYDIHPGNRVGLFWDTKHTHTYLPTYLMSPDPHGNTAKHRTANYFSITHVSNCLPSDVTTLTLLSRFTQWLKKLFFKRTLNCNVWLCDTVLTHILSAYIFQVGVNQQLYGRACWRWMLAGCAWWRHCEISPRVSHAL